MRMSLRWFAWAAVPVVLVAACGKPPKQAEVPDVDKGTGVDMGAEEAAPKPVSSAAAGEAAPSEADMKAKCCAACKEGLAKDRTGASPTTIPCADFTAQLTPWCLEHFRAHPAMASECK